MLFVIASGCRRTLTSCKWHFSLFTSPQSTQLGSNNQHLTFTIVRIETNVIIITIFGGCGLCDIIKSSSFPLITLPCEYLRSRLHEQCEFLHSKIQASRQQQLPYSIRFSIHFNIKINSRAVRFRLGNICNVLFASNLNHPQHHHSHSSYIRLQSSHKLFTHTFRIIAVQHFYKENNGVNLYSLHNDDTILCGAKTQNFRIDQKVFRIDFGWGWAAHRFAVLCIMFHTMRHYTQIL